MKTSRRRPNPEPLVDIAWSHAGVCWRVTAWPEVSFERRLGDDWVPDHPSDGAFAAAAADVKEVSWSRYLEFVPPVERRFIESFRFNRMEALQVVARCPELLAELDDTPALTVFLSGHAALRGAGRPVWHELAAVFHRSGLFGLFEWLGLPATRHALAALRNLADPEIPRRFIAPLRTQLWDGVTVRTLEAATAITDLDLCRIAAGRGIESGRRGRYRLAA